MHNGYWISEQKYVSGDYRLTRESPCIDAGVTWNEVNVDILEKLRPYDWEGIDNNAFHVDVDMGCYELQKTRPVADAGTDQVLYAFVDGYALVQLDGSDSYDADGDALEYYWYDGNELIATGVEPNVLLPVGEHVIDLIVNDGIEDSEPNWCVVTVVEALEGRAAMLPRWLNRNRHGRTIIGWLILPEGVSASDVDRDVPLSLLAGDAEIPAQWQHVLPGRRRGGNGGRVSIIAFFDTDALLDAVGENGTTEVTLAGGLVSGQVIYGTDEIRIFQPRRRIPWWKRHRR